MGVTRVKRHGTHNSDDATGLKRRLRRDALAHAGGPEARVLDLFCGPIGDAWTHAWSEAGDYLGVDVEYRPWDSRARLVCPWELALQHLDPTRHNVFDLDAFGSPWGALARLVERLVECGGVRGRVAFVTTDGSWRAVRTGRTLTIDADLRRLGIPQAPRNYSGRGELSRVALASAAQRLDLTIDTLGVYSASSRAGHGASSLTYSVLLAHRTES